MSSSVNYDVLNEIKELQSESDPDVLVTLLKMFLASVPQKIAKIEVAIRVAKPEDVRREAHSLKSSAANLGAVQMAAFCSELEMLGKGGDLSSASALFSKLKAEVLVVTHEFESLPEMQAFEKKSA